MWLKLPELIAVVHELNSGLRGAFLQKVFQPDSHDLWLDFRIPGRSIWLWISTAPGAERIAVAEGRPEARKNPLGLQQWLRKYAVGQRFEGCVQNEWLVEFQFARATLRVDFKAHKFEARVRAPSADVPTDESPAPNPGEVEREAHDFPLARALAGKEPERVDEEQRRLQQHLKKLKRTREKVAAEAARGPLAEKYRHDGELLSRNLERVERGASSVKVTEYTAEGPTERIIELDPAKTPRQHSEWLFHQYRRLKRGVDIASQRLIELDEQIARAQAPPSTGSGQAHSTGSGQAHSTGSGQAHSTGPGQAQARPRKRDSSGVEKSKPYREYRASTGQAVWVGRGAKHNDSLTFQIARPHHVWLHARGVPGAHVVVPIEKKQVLDQETLLDAAHLAFHFSGYRDEPSGEVSYTFVRYVKNSPAPGAVTYTRESTFWLRVEPDRLKRLLRSADALPG